MSNYLLGGKIGSKSQQKKKTERKNTVSLTQQVSTVISLISDVHEYEANLGAYRVKE